MKIIVTGATGFVGRHVVLQCIANPQVTTVLVLTRKEIAPELSSSPKVRLVLHQDFGSYPAAVLDQLEGAEGCIWAIGGKAGDFPDLETAKRVSVDYTLAAAEAFATSLAAKLEGGKKFPFVFCSGNGAEQEEDKKLWFFPDTRKIKGAVEKGLMRIADQHSSVFSTFVLRPGGILPGDQQLMYKVASALISAVLVTDVARALVKVCLEQPKDTIFENDEILALSKAAAL